jgi:charged multivesicular body protein 1
MVMDKFEQQFEDLDVQSQYMENSISNTTTLTTPQDDVDRLMQQVSVLFSIMCTDVFRLRMNTVWN